MITREQFEQLEALDAGNNLVLSTYLDLDPERQVRRAYRIIFFQVRMRDYLAFEPRADMAARRGCATAAASGQRNGCVATLSPPGNAGG